MRATLLSLVLAAATAPVWPAGPMDRGDAIPTAAEDPAGYRLCPYCDKVNPPQALYCMACGARLVPRVEAPWPRTPTALAPELHVRDNTLTAGIVMAYDGGSWGNEAGLAALNDFSDVAGAALADNIYFYFSERRLRPYISVEPFVAYTDGEAVGRLAVGGGARYGYDRYGSYAYAGVSAGAYLDDGHVSPMAAIHARLLYCFTPRIGIGGAIGGSIFWSAISFGPSFAL